MRLDLGLVKDVTEERAEEYGEAMTQVRGKQNGVKRKHSELVLYYLVYAQIYSQPICSCSVS